MTPAPSAMTLTLPTIAAVAWPMPGSIADTRWPVIVYQSFLPAVKEALEWLMTRVLSTYPNSGLDTFCGPVDSTSAEVTWVGCLGSFEIMVFPFA